MRAGNPSGLTAQACGGTSKGEASPSLSWDPMFLLLLFLAMHGKEFAYLPLAPAFRQE